MNQAIEKIFFKIGEIAERSYESGRNQMPIDDFGIWLENQLQILTKLVKELKKETVIFISDLILQIGIEQTTDSKKIINILQEYRRKIEKELEEDK